MGHHNDERGCFQSDLHPWLPPDMILISTTDPASRPAIDTWLTIMGHGLCGAFVDFRSERERPRPKLLVDFQDRASWPILVALAESYAGHDPGLAEDVFARLKALGWVNGGDGA